MAPGTTIAKGWNIRLAKRVTLLWTLLSTIQGQGSGEAWDLESWQPHEQWRIQQGRVAPWAPRGTTTLHNAGLAGQTIRFEAERVQAPEPLDCERAQHEFVLSPAEGLFQGGLPAPAPQAAKALGFRQMPVLTWRVTCTNGSFDCHLTGPRQAFLGLDDVVWSLTRTSPDTAPEAAVLELLRDHMTHDMAFTNETVSGKKGGFTGDLRRAISIFLRGRPRKTRFH